jgi:hypothetical protein
MGILNIHGRFCVRAVNKILKMKLLKLIKLFFSKKKKTYEEWKYIGHERMDD